MVTQFLIPVRGDTKRMLELLKFEAQVRDKKRVSYDELVKELMTCGSAQIVGVKTRME